MIIYLFVFCSIFKLLTELKEDNLGDDFPVISLFQKRRHINKDGDIPIHQLNSETWGMGAYLAILEEGEDNSEGLQKLANIVCTKMNVFASKSKSNCNPISYKGNLTEGLTEENRKSLDYYIVTEYVVKFARDYYSEEIDADTFLTDVDLIDALFGRKENSQNPMATMNRYD